MLKPYYERGKPSPVLAVDGPFYASSHADVDPEVLKKTDHPLRLPNSEILSNISSNHLTPDEKKEVTHLIRNFHDLFPDVPRRTNIAQHDVDVGNAKPVKQHPYRVNPQEGGNNTARSGVHASPWDNRTQSE